MTPLAGRVALVTGASSGIGRAIAEALAARRAVVHLVGRKPEALDAVAAICRAAGGEVVTHRADLLVDEDIERLASRLANDPGRVDVVVHTAGVAALAPMETAPVRDLDWHLATNVRAPYALTRALLPMIRAVRGQIVFLNSSAVLRPMPRAGQYAASKHALKAVADALRDEVNSDGVRVLSVYVGRTATPMQASVHAMEGRPYRPERLIQPSDVAEMIVAALELPSTAEVTDLTIRPLTPPSAAS